MKFRVVEKDVKLVMFENVDMPESIAGKDASGKTVFNKTGKTLPYTCYTFRDISGDKFEVTSKDNSYRALEGQNVVVDIDVSMDNFTKKMKLARLVSVEKAK